MNDLGQNLAAPAALGFEISVGEFDFVDRRTVVVAHREIEFGKEGFLIFVDAVGFDQVDVDIQGFHLPQTAVLGAHELDRSELCSPEALRQDDDEGVARRGSRRRHERPIVETAFEAAAAGGVGVGEGFENLAAQTRDIG